MQNKIQKSFTLGGSKWVVEYANDPTNGNTLGKCDSTACKITLYVTLAGEEISEETMYNSFLHELTHAILITYAYFRENSNEKIVSAMASGLAQCFLSAEYEKPTSKVVKNKK